MFYLYMDNFRGFQDTVVPMKDVNFLVGENSSGKTSVMALVSILSGMGFWMTSPSFEEGGAKLGTYEDIVSAHAENKSYFRVGMFEASERGKTRHAYLVSYERSEGMPTISRYTCELDGRLIDVAFRGKGVRFRSEKASEVVDDGIVGAREWFRSWGTIHREGGGPYKTFRGAPKELLMRSLGVVNHYLLSEEEGTGRRDKRRGIGMSGFGPYPNTVWLAPIRTKPKSTYDEHSLRYSPEGEHTPYLIKRYFKRKKEKERFLEFLSAFGVNSGLFKTVGVRNFGRTVTAPFELDVGLDGIVLKIVNVGYGVSQALPVIVELFEQDSGTCYFIQQPEVHLHPRAQAAMGELFFDLSVKENKEFVVETHSDFIIDRFRLRLRESENKPESQVLYFTRDSEGNKVYPIEILNNGDFTDKQPSGYREFFVREQIRILGM